MKSWGECCLRFVKTIHSFINEDLMKFSLHCIAAAVLASACSFGHAAPITVSPGAPFRLINGTTQVEQVLKSGSQLFTWGDGDYDGVDTNTLGGPLLFFNFVDIKPSGDGLTEEFKPNDGDYILRTSARYLKALSSLTIEQNDGQLMEVSVGGGMTLTSTKTPSLTTGGTVSIDNLRIDFINKTVTANLTGIKNAVGTAPAVSYNSPNTVIWTFTDLVGPTALDPNDLIGNNAVAALTAKGFVVNAQGEVSATHAISNLQITTAGTTFFSRSLGLLSTAINGMSGVNLYGPDAWGTITLTSQFGKIGGTVSGSGEVINKGQTLATGLTLRSGVPLRIKHISSVSRMNVSPLVYDTSTPALTLQGALPWFNVFGVNPQPNATGLAYNDAISDPRFGSGSAEGQVRHRMRVISNGSFVTLNKTSGEVASLGGFRSDMSGAYMNGAIGGGAWSAQNINYVLAANSAYGDLSGSNAAVGSGSGEQPVAAQTGVPLWTYDSVTGPASIPLSALAAATSNSNLPSLLQAAGFVVNSATSSEIVFSGTYSLGGLNLTTPYKEYACQALACSQVAKDALMTPQTNHLGDFSTTVKFSIPLLP